MKIYALAAIAAAVLAIAASVYWAGGRSARQEADRLRDHIGTTERMRDADPDFSDCPWDERLRGECAR